MPAAAQQMLLLALVLLPAAPVAGWDSCRRPAAAEAAARDTRARCYEHGAKTE
jgi:hypothetical protein